MSQQTKKVKPKAEENWGPGGQDYALAFKTSHLGVALCTSNPAQEKLLKRQWDELEKARRQREATLFHTQRDFFIAQVFGKGLNPHLKKGLMNMDDEVSRNENRHSECKPSTVAVHKLLTPPDESAKPANRGILQKPEIKITKCSDDVASCRGDVADSVSGSMMITQSEDMNLTPRAGQRSFMSRSQTSGDLKIYQKQQYQSLPLLTSDMADPEVRPVGRDKHHVSFIEDLTRSTSDLASSTSGCVGSYRLPSIHQSPKQAEPLPDDTDDVEADDNDDAEQIDTASTVISVHTITDHIGQSNLQRAKKKTIAFLREDPERIFPKMRLLLKSYDSETHETFNEIMELNNWPGSRASSVKSNYVGLHKHYIAKSAREHSSIHRIQDKRIKTAIKSANEKIIQAVSTEDKLQACFKKFPDQGCPNHPMKVSSPESSKVVDRKRHKDKTDTYTLDETGKYNSKLEANSIVGGLTLDSSHQYLTPRSQFCFSKTKNSDEDLLMENVRRSHGDVELSETQRYVKMMQQITGVLSNNLLMAAESQIKELSNTEEIMKFKEDMIVKNRDLMSKDMMVDPRWRRLERTLVNEKKKNGGKWHKSHKVWLSKP